ncbi:MAG: Rrf2 family transcriptional regulator [Gemmatimonadota bacterium]|nr:Rrf2 family transcriptional regulator [Gemmatimonadota bacterium]
MITVSERVNLAIHALGYMAANRERLPLSVTTLAHSLKVSRSHLAKVMQTLARQGFVNSCRGANGGFSFARNPDETSLLEIYEVIEGPLGEENGCLLGSPVCEPGSCMLTGLLKEIEKSFLRELGGKKIGEFRAR